MDFKPNLAASLLLLIALFALAEWLLFDGPSFLLPLATIATALSLLAKPPFFPFIGFMVVASFGSAALLRLFSRPPAWHPPLDRTAIVLAVVAPLLLVTPYALVSGEEVVRMLLQHIAPGGDYQEVWTIGAAKRNNLLYFLTGNGGVMLGPQVWIAGGLWAAVLLFLPKAPAPYVRATLLLGALLLFAYLPPTITAVKHRFTGMLFQLILILGPVYLLALRHHLQGPGRYFTLPGGALAAGALASLLLIDARRSTGGLLYPPEQGAEQKAVARAILDEVVGRSSGKQFPQLILFTTGLLNSDTLAWVARSTDSPIRIPNSGNVVTLRRTDQVTRHADFILAADPDALGTYRWHPVTREAEHLFDWIEESGRYRRVRAFPTSAGGSFYLYEATEAADPDDR